MSLLAIAVIRAVVGLCLVAVAIAALIYSFLGEGSGCLNGIILGVIFLICVIVVNVLGEEPLEAFFGTGAWDVMGGLLVVSVGCLYFSMSKIAGILSSLALGFTGLLVTGFLAAEDVAILSQGITDLGIVILLPIALPMALLIVLVGLAWRM